MKKILVQIALAFSCAVLLADSQGFSVHAQKADVPKHLSGDTEIDRFNKLSSLPIIFEENRGQIRSNHDDYNEKQPGSFSAASAVAFPQFK